MTDEGVEPAVETPAPSGSAPADPAQTTIGGVATDEIGWAYRDLIQASAQIAYLMTGADMDRFDFRPSRNSAWWIETEREGWRRQLRSWRILVQTTGSIMLQRFGTRDDFADCCEAQRRERRQREQTLLRRRNYFNFPSAGNYAAWFDAMALLLWAQEDRWASEEVLSWDRRPIPPKDWPPKDGHRFALGSVVVMNDARKALKAAKIKPETLIERHARGDWGDPGPFNTAIDWRQNEAAIDDGDAVTSRYGLPDGAAIRVSTNADRTCTSVLLPNPAYDQ